MMFRCSTRRAALAVPVLLIIIILGFQSSAHANDDASVAILYHETIQLTSPTEATKTRTTLTAFDSPATLSFDAYGRRFELQVDETRVVTDTNFTRLSGRLSGLPDSWFSLLRDGTTLSGIIDDGVDTYLVEPRHRVADLLIETSADRAPANVIFRLADTLLPDGLMSCASEDSARSGDEISMHRVDGQSAFNKLSSELQATTITATLSGNPRLLVGVVADRRFFTEHEADTESEIATIFNTVEGIYANEIGLAVEIDRVFSVTPGITNPLSGTVVGGDLLDELGVWRSANQADLGHTHLLTRRRLINDDGDSIAGISYLGQPGRSGICNPVTGASLSRDIRGLTALIVTHEIGHNLGAPHDGNQSGACAAEPEGQFIMSPSISRGTAVSFSDCSIAQMDRVISAAACLDETAEAFPATNSGGGGGGLGWLSLVSLLAVAILRRRER